MFLKKIRNGINRILAKLDTFDEILQSLQHKTTMIMETNEQLAGEMQQETAALTDFTQKLTAFENTLTTNSDQVPQPVLDQWTTLKTAIVGLAQLVPGAPAAAAAGTNG